MRLYEHLRQLHTADIADCVRQCMLAHSECVPAPCDPGQTFPAMLSRRSSKQDLRAVLAFLAHTAHPFDGAPLRVAVIDFLSADLREFEHCSNMDIIVPDTMPHEHDDNPPAIQLHTAACDVVVLHGFDFIWHVQPVALRDSISAVLAGVDTSRVAVIVLRALSHFSGRERYPECAPWQLEILPAHNQHVL